MHKVLVYYCILTPIAISFQCREISSTQASIFANVYPEQCGLGVFRSCNVSEIIIMCDSVNVNTYVITNN